MYAKVFAQIFDSSIAENHKVRHVFEDLLKLADQTGDVDMTVDAIARRTNVPFEEVAEAIKKLEEPDNQSRSKECEGRRIIRLDDHREWGWHIVNYLHYRGIMDEESRRSFFREAKRRQREKMKLALAAPNGGPKKNGHREPWQIQKDLETFKARLDEIRRGFGQEKNGDGTWTPVLNPEQRAAVNAQKEKIKILQAELDAAPV